MVAGEFVAEFLGPPLSTTLQMLHIPELERCGEDYRQPAEFLSLVLSRKSGHIRWE